MKFAIKRILSVLLVLCMMLSVLPVGAAADDRTVSIPVDVDASALLSGDALTIQLNYGDNKSSQIAYTSDMGSSVTFVVPVEEAENMSVGVTVSGKYDYTVTNPNYKYRPASLGTFSDYDRSCKSLVFNGSELAIIKKGSDYYVLSKAPLSDDVKTLVRTAAKGLDGVNANTVLQFNPGNNPQIPGVTMTDSGFEFAEHSNWSWLVRASYSEASETITRGSVKITLPKRDITVTKTWLYNEEKEELPSVSIQLKKNGKLESSCTLSKENGWTHTFPDLQKKNDDGSEIQYTVTESPVPDGYQSSVTGTMAEGFIVTNVKDVRISVSGTKSWVDNNNNDGKRPTSITVNLLANGVATQKSVEVRADAEGKWEWSFTNLPKYENGREIVYTVEEVAVEGYTSNGLATKDNNYTITNTHTPETITISGEKTWEDNHNQDGKRPQKITLNLLANGDKTQKSVEVKADAEGKWEWSFTNLPKYENGQEIVYTVDEVAVEGYTSSGPATKDNKYTITNTHVPATTSVSVEKVWNDENDLDGFRPDSVQVRLYELTNDGPTNPVGEPVTLNAAGKWEYTWTNLPAKNAGRDINYTVIELPVESYTARYSGSMADGFTITNTHEVEKMNVTVHKTWADGNDADGLRPDEVTVQLLRNGTKVGEATLNAENQWTCTFENQPVYAGGEEAVYVVVEKAVANYQAKVVYKETDTGLAAEITNTYTPDETSITVTKKWTDNDDKLGERPDQVTIYLLADGEKTGDELVLNKENKWTGTFEDLPLNKDGKEIKYTVSEKSVKNYNAKVTGSAEKGFVVTNTHTSIPTTGDESNLPLYAVLFSVGAVALVSAVVLGRKKYGKRG